MYSSIYGLSSIGVVNISKSSASPKYRRLVSFFSVWQEGSRQNYGKEVNEQLKRMLYNCTLWLVATLLAKNPWDTYKQMIKTIFLSTSSSLYFTDTPTAPLEQCWFHNETLDILSHVKFFRYHMYFLQKPKSV